MNIKIEGHLIRWSPDETLKSPTHVQKVCASYLDDGSQCGWKSSAVPNSDEGKAEEEWGQHRVATTTIRFDKGGNPFPASMHVCITQYLCEE